MRTAFRFIEDRLAGALRAWMIVGILLRVTRIRDRFDGLSLVYYSTPWPALAAGFVVLAVHHYRRANWHPMRRYIAFTVVALFTWIATSWYSVAAVEGETNVRLVQWNVARPIERLTGCTKWLKAQNPDIICLSEAQPEHTPSRDLWQLEFPDYRVLTGAANMMCLVRGEVASSVGFTVGASSYGALHRVRIRGREVTILQVDVIALPARSRKAQLAKVAEIANGHPNGNLIVVGDFNTPRESAHLDALRGKFRHAFEASGRGLAETWPGFAPALNIDQIWIGKTWQPLTCRHAWTWRSDHRPVVVDLAAKDR